jgi:hypothetical protein
MIGTAICRLALVLLLAASVKADSIPFLDHESSRGDIESLDAPDRFLIEGGVWTVFGTTFSSHSLSISAWIQAEGTLPNETIGMAPLLRAQVSAGEPRFEGFRVTIRLEATDFQIGVPLAVPHAKYHSHNLTGWIEDASARLRISVILFSARVGLCSPERVFG